MARFARVVVPGGAYHVTHRGNRGAPIFHADADRESYLASLSEASRRHGVEVWAYCLMSNHVHLILKAEAPDSMSKAIHVAHMRLARAVNERLGWSGHLWANRFFSTLLDERHLWNAVRYVELNPVRAGIASVASDYSWSSARANARLAIDPLLSPTRPFPGPMFDWRDFLDTELEPEAFEAIRRNTSTGRPSGSDAFVKSLEARLGRRLRPQPRGRRSSTKTGKPGTG